MKKAIRYLRYSSKSQHNSFSIERQDMVTAEWCRQNKIIITDTFIDEGYSARNFDRPDINKLFEFIKKNYIGIDYLVVAELTRFSRETGGAISTVNKIQEQYDIRIVSCMRGAIYDCLDPNSFFMMGLEFLQGNSENIKRKNDIDGGIYTAKAKEGRYIGSRAPYGYIKEGAGKEQRLQINPLEAAVVKMIYKEYLLNTPMYIIHKKALEMGLKRRDNDIVLYILRNPAYAALLQVKPWKNNPGGLFPAKHEPIIDVLTWNMVQKKLAGAKTRTEISDELPLRNIVKCHCGTPLTGAPSTGKMGVQYYYYKCKHKGHNNISAKKAHTQIEQIMQELSLPERLTISIANKSEELLEERMKEQKKLLQYKKMQLQQTEEKLHSLEEKFISNQLAPESYTRWYQQLNAERLTYTKEVREMSTDQNQLLLLLKNNLVRLTDMQFLWQQSSTLQKQELIRLGFDNQLYYKNNLYRTPVILPILAHNILKLKHKQLLEVDGMSEKPGQVELTQFLSNPAINFIAFLSSIKAA